MDELFRPMSFVTGLSFVDGQHGDEMGLKTTVDPALIRGLVTALVPSATRGP